MRGTAKPGRRVHRSFPATSDCVPVIDVDGIQSTPTGRCVVTIERDVFSKILEGAAEHAGSRDVAIKAGRVCGKGFAEELESSVHAHYDVPLCEIPLVEFREVLARACERHGYARVSIDTTHVRHGVLEIRFDGKDRADLELAFLSGLVITLLERLTGDVALGGVLVEDRDGDTSCVITSKERLAGFDAGAHHDRSEVLASLRMAEGVTP